MKRAGNLVLVSDRATAPLTATPQIRGYRVHYRSGTPCPGCGGGKWHVGRQSAECASCGTALPIAPETIR